MKRSHRPVSHRGRNLLALVVAATAVGLLHLNDDPLSVGGSPLARAASGPPRAGRALPPSPPLPVRLEDGDGDTTLAEQPATTRVDDPQVLQGIWALKMSYSLLEKGCKSFSKVTDYTAVMHKQERINGRLGAGQEIELKLRHEPFSVYMKWTSGDRGRQLIYVEGQNDGNMLVQPGGIKGRLTGVMSLDPQGTMAMAESRYPVTQAGLLELARTVLKYQRQDLERGTGFTCELRDDETFEDRPCYLYTVVYDSPEIHPEYRKSMLYIDKELSMPICVKNFTWARDPNPETIDEDTLVEFYAYTDLEIRKRLSTADFDQHNSDYRLRVKR
jgi:hypothetical protein